MLLWFVKILLIILFLNLLSFFLIFLVLAFLRSFSILLNFQCLQIVQVRFLKEKFSYRTPNRKRKGNQLRYHRKIFREHYCRIWSSKTGIPFEKILSHQKWLGPGKLGKVLLCSLLWLQVNRYGIKNHNEIEQETKKPSISLKNKSTVWLKKQKLDKKPR